MKKALSILLTAAFLMTAMAGCSNDEVTPIEEEESVVEESEVDNISSASVKESAEAEDVVNGLSENGYWIFSLLGDVTIEGELKVEGTFYNRDDKDDDVYRKLALYAQDENRNVTEEYTLTVERMLVASPNFRIQNGTVVGDIYITEEGFELAGTTVEGNLYFATQELQDSANLAEGVVTGEIAIGVAEEIEADEAPTEVTDELEGAGEEAGEVAGDGATATYEENEEAGEEEDAA